MKIISIITFLFISTVAFAQKTQPVGGKGALEIVYYRIDFSKEDTEYLRTHAPELIFSVSETGKAKLEKVNDIDRTSIVDSLMKMNDHLPEFYPERVNGKNEVGVYFLKITWPNYQNYQTPNTLNVPVMTVQYSPARKLTDFDEITYRSPRFDMLIGGFATGNNGWGTKFDFIIYGKNNWGGGFGTSFIINKTDNAERKQMITLINGSVGKIFPKEKGGEFAIQFEPGFGITGATSTSDHGLGMGFVPGISVAYLLPLGKGRMVRQYFLPVAYKQYFSFHVAARQLIMNIKEASGTVYEFGVSYRFAQRPVLNYKLKDSAN